MTGHQWGSSISRQPIRAIIVAGLLVCSGAAMAGPPYRTDDPEPTDTGHWEIYAPLVELEGTGDDIEGTAGVEVNFGAAPDVQLTMAVPIAFSSGERDAAGLGDIELAAKYRFFHDEAAGISVATFPGLTLPTGTNHFSGGHVSAFLPLWAQKDAGPWSIFGGGGYTINPGDGNRDYWSSGIAVTRDLSKRLQLGAEVTHQGPDAVDAVSTTSLGLGAIYHLKAPFTLLASGGPTFPDGDNSTQFHAFVALRLDY
jgi:hypothetical protein